MKMVICGSSACITVRIVHCSQGMFKAVELTRVPMYHCHDFGVYHPAGCSKEQFLLIPYERLQNWSTVPHAILYIISIPFFIGEKHFP